MKDVIYFFNQNQIFALFTIISVGFLIGRIKIKNFSLDSSAILFVALYAGHLGVKVPYPFKTLGLLFFVYSIGLQAGPKFFSFFGKNGRSLNFLAFFIVSIGALTAILLSYLFHLKGDTVAGLFAGALTSTPGLAAAEEATGSKLTSIAYGISYPFGVIGVIIFLKIAGAISHTEKEDKAEKQKEEFPIFQHNIVKNPAIFGKSLRELRFRTITNCVISRIMRGNSVFIPKPETKLEENDILRVVGKKEDLKNADYLLGGKTDKTIPSTNIGVKKFVITNREIVGKTVGEIALNSYFHATLTRINRGGIEFPAMLNHKLEWGDRVTVAGEKDSWDSLKKLFGDDLKALEEGSIYSVILGMVIGIMAGMIPFSLGNIFSIKMGITGGVLLSGLILSNIGKTGPIIWRAPSPIVNFVRELGLVLFLAEVGTQAGENFASVIQSNGTTLLIAGSIITITPMIATYLINKIFFKLNFLKLSGVITGGMTSTPGLATVSSSFTSDLPVITYAAVYPVAMISVMLWAKIIAFLL